MAPKRKRNDTIQVMLQRVLSNQEEFSKRFEESMKLSDKRKSDSVQDKDTNATKKMATMETICMTTSNQLGPNPRNNLEGHLSSDLPMDTADLVNQAVQLLEESNFAEVLNKIPEDALNDLLSEPKNGDSLPTEELSRTLPAVGQHCSQMGVGQATMLPTANYATANNAAANYGFCNLATLDHGHYHNQAIGNPKVMTTASTFQQFPATTEVLIPRSSNATNAISCLNEICPGIHYQEVSHTGPSHSPLFTFVASFNGVSYIGTGPNKKYAKHAAAEAVLKSFSCK